MPPPRRRKSKPSGRRRNPTPNRAASRNSASPGMTARGTVTDRQRAAPVAVDEMRIVGGELRGRPLATPRSQAIRPTTDRTREAVFNVLTHRFSDRLAGAQVLDLFAGTGALGLEALSRGAARCLFVEESAEGRGLIRTNVEAFGLAGANQDLSAGCDGPGRCRNRPAIRPGVCGSALWKGPCGGGAAFGLAGRLAASGRPVRGRGGGFGAFRRRATASLSATSAPMAKPSSGLSKPPSTTAKMTNNSLTRDRLGVHKADHRQVRTAWSNR